MKYLLDTNVVSELYKPRPHPAVTAWFKKQDPSSIYLTAITIGEIRRGIEKRRVGTQYPDSIERFAKALAHMELAYAGRILAFDQMSAHAWATITLHYPDKILDTQIAGIALANNAVIVTRDKDFTDLASRIAPLGIALPLINPFETY